MNRANCIRALSITALLALAAACGGAPTTDDGGGSPTDGTLTVTPAQSEHVILNGVRPTQDYTATLTHLDGTTEDVTADVFFSVDGNVGGFAGAQLTMVAPGKGTIIAAYADHTAAAAVIVSLRDVRVGAGVDPGAPGLFGGGPEDPARAPSVVYPAEGVQVPRNLGDFEVHWTDGSSNDVYELSLTSELTDVRVYLRGGNGAGGGPNPSYAAFTAQEWADAVGSHGSVQYQVRGVDSANPSAGIGSAAPRLVKVTNEALEGGIYYWAAKSTTGTSPEGIWRHDMAKPGEPAEKFYTREESSGRCVACHVLSRDGTKMALTWDGGSGAATVMDVATRTPMADLPGWDFGTFSPDATRFLGVQDAVITVYNTADMSSMGAMPVDVAGTQVSHPDLSPDGSRLVYSHLASGGDIFYNGGTLWTRSYDAVTNAFGPETPLVAAGAAGANNYYPSFSPDGEWVLFNRSETGSAYNNPGASMWIVKADGSAPPIQLAAANAQPGLANSWGRWAPFVQTIGVANEPIFWITVSSQRDFGVRLVGLRQPQIWMTPFYPERASVGQDPSAPAFRLPFQNIETSNHIAQWTERVVVLQ